MNWQTRLLPMDEAFIAKHPPLAIVKPITDKLCHFYKAQFNLNEIGDTYFDLSQYSKGMVYVNGHNLGRYWNIGPQQKIFCPADWLKKAVMKSLYLICYNHRPHLYLLGQL